MAEDKKGFLLYADYQELFEELSDENAGKLIKHIYKYVNDENPETDDPFVKLAFIPIKKQLKRDLIHWESVKEKRSKAGLASAESKRKKKLTEVNTSEQTPTKSTHVESVQQKSTQSTVSVNGNVNVNVNERLEANKNLHPSLIGFKKNVLENATEQNIDEKTALEFFEYWTAVDENSGKFLYQATNPFGIRNRMKNWKSMEKKIKSEKPVVKKYKAFK